MMKKSTFRILTFSLSLVIFSFSIVQGQPVLAAEDNPSCIGLKSAYDAATTPAAKADILRQGKEADCIWAGGKGEKADPTDGSTTSSGKFVIDNPIEADDFSELINLIAKWIFNISIPIAIIMIIYAGLKMIFAQGNPSTFASAQKMLWYAILGLIVIFIGKGFITLIKSILSIGS